MASTEPPRPPKLAPLSTVLPPLLLGTATFNTQYVADPAAMPYRGIVRRALVDLGVQGFDTSPYYGPSEALLGEALAATGVARERFFLETKAGRVHSRGFDYTPAAVQTSVRRSLQRLRTSYVDLVLAHDAEFVAPDDVVAAVRALRELRAGVDGRAGALRYVGLSGFPVDVLADLAERVLAATGEPLDAVLSYGHCTVQNTALLGSPLDRLRRAGVSVVLNASLLNMGLLTARGVDLGPQAAWHPSPAPLRAASAAVAACCREHARAGQLFGMTGIEQLALRYSLDLWARAAAAAGVATAAAAAGVATAAAATATATAAKAAAAPVPIGASVLGVTSEAELDETVREWWSILDAFGLPHPSLDDSGVSAATAGPLLLPAAVAPADAAAAAADTADAAARQAASLQRMQQVRDFVEEKLWPVFGEWKDFSWDSPSADWVNELAPGTATKL